MPHTRPVPNVSPASARGLLAASALLICAAVPAASAAQTSPLERFRAAALLIGKPKSALLKEFGVPAQIHGATYAYVVDAPRGEPSGSLFVYAGDGRVQWVRGVFSGYEGKDVQRIWDAIKAVRSEPDAAFYQRNDLKNYWLARDAFDPFEGVYLRYDLEGTIASGVRARIMGLRSKVPVVIAKRRVNLRTDRIELPPFQRNKAFRWQSCRVSEGMALTIYAQESINLPAGFFVPPVRISLK